MVENKTKPTDVAVEDFLRQVEHPQRRADALVLNDVFKRVTGYQPVLWGPTMVGYGAYAYTYESGHSGRAMATGFSPRKANMVIYIMPGYGHFGPQLARLGKHKMGKSCLYINKLDDIDLTVLEEIIRLGLADLATHWPVTPT